MANTYFGIRNMTRSMAYPRIRDILESLHLHFPSVDHFHADYLTMSVGKNDIIQFVKNRVASQKIYEIYSTICFLHNFNKKKQHIFISFFYITV